MTWVRAYENYANVVLTNHGQFGGSFAWSPRHGRGKAIVRLHGSKLNLVADVRLPVRDLFQAQQNRPQEGIEEATREWLEPEHKRAQSDKGAFKTPPPGYRRKHDA